eukprot:CAMPEP_0174256830 /NCGR_PEP_ID=MMETSP0439-20130205/6022_1 /TAXON_ID=0 /ORGANISM="Stereomyxa ramosa, Strain Chinc5" /LENGTH=138 /DNA_ID=CAMNT_0015339625 /DNA_START=12 /DNA_END=428 /DNA_ORIENTATION=-
MAQRGQENNDKTTSGYYYGSWSRSVKRGDEFSESKQKTNVTLNDDDTFEYNKTWETKTSNARKYGTPGRGSETASGTWRVSDGGGISLTGTNQHSWKPVGGVEEKRTQDDWEMKLKPWHFDLGGKWLLGEPTFRKLLE